MVFGTMGSRVWGERSWPGEQREQRLADRRKVSAQGVNGRGTCRDSGMQDRVWASKGSGCHLIKGFNLGEGHADDFGAGLEGEVGGGGWGVVQAAVMRPEPRQPVPRGWKRRDRAEK